jgi:hypothetical protein
MCCGMRRTVLDMPGRTQRRLVGFHVIMQPQTISATIAAKKIPSSSLSIMVFSVA